MGNNKNQKNVIYGESGRNGLTYTQKINFTSGKTSDNQSSPLIAETYNDGMRQLVDNDLYLRGFLQRLSGYCIGPKKYDSQTFETADDGYKTWYKTADSDLSVLRKVIDPVSSTVEYVGYAGNRINFIDEYSNIIFAGTAGGLLYSSDGQTFGYMDVVAGGCIGRHFSDSAALFAFDDGIYQLYFNDEEPTLVRRDKSGLDNCRSVFLDEQTERVFAGTADGAYSAKWTTASAANLVFYRHENLLNGTCENSISVNGFTKIAQTESVAAGDDVLAMTETGVYQSQYGQTAIDARHGLEGVSCAACCFLNGMAYIGTEDGLYSVDNLSDAVVDADIRYTAAGGSYVYALAADGTLYWFRPDGGQIESAVLSGSYTGIAALEFGDSHVAALTKTGNSVVFYDIDNNLYSQTSIYGFACSDGQADPILYAALGASVSAYGGFSAGWHATSQISGAAPYMPDGSSSYSGRNALGFFTGQDGYIYAAASDGVYRRGVKTAFLSNAIRVRPVSDGDTAYCAQDDRGTVLFDAQHAQLCSIPDAACFAQTDSYIVAGAERVLSCLKKTQLDAEPYVLELTSDIACLEDDGSGNAYALISGTVQKIVECKTMKQIECVESETVDFDYAVKSDISWLSGVEYAAGIYAAAFQTSARICVSAQTADGILSILLDKPVYGNANSVRINGNGVEIYGNGISSFYIVENDGQLSVVQNAVEKYGRNINDMARSAGKTFFASDAGVSAEGLTSENLIAASDMSGCIQMRSPAEYAYLAYGGHGLSSIYSGTERRLETAGVKFAKQFETDGNFLSHVILYGTDAGVFSMSASFESGLQFTDAEQLLPPASGMVAVPYSGENEYSYKLIAYGEAGASAVYVGSDAAAPSCVISDEIKYIDAFQSGGLSCMLALGGGGTLSVYDSETYSLLGQTAGFSDIIQAVACDTKDGLSVFTLDANGTLSAMPIVIGGGVVDIDISKAEKKLDGVARIDRNNFICEFGADGNTVYSSDIYEITDDFMKSDSQLLTFIQSELYVFSDHVIRVYNAEIMLDGRPCGRIEPYLDGVLALFSDGELAYETADISKSTVKTGIAAFTYDGQTCRAISQTGNLYRDLIAASSSSIEYIDGSSDGVAIPRGTSSVVDMLNLVEGTIISYDCVYILGGTCFYDDKNDTTPELREMANTYNTGIVGVERAYSGAIAYSVSAIYELDNFTRLATQLGEIRKAWRPAEDLFVVKKTAGMFYITGNRTYVFPSSLQSVNSAQAQNGILVLCTPNGFVQPAYAYNESIGFKLLSSATLDGTALKVEWPGTGRAVYVAERLSDGYAAMQTAQYNRLNGELAVKRLGYWQEYGMNGDGLFRIEHDVFDSVFMIGCAPGEFFSFSDGLKGVCGADGLFEEYHDMRLTGKEYDVKNVFKYDDMIYFMLGDRLLQSRGDGRSYWFERIMANGLSSSAVAGCISASDSRYVFATDTGIYTLVDDGFPLSTSVYRNQLSPETDTYIGGWTSGISSVYGKCAGDMLYTSQNLKKWTNFIQIPDAAAIYGVLPRNTYEYYFATDNGIYRTKLSYTVSNDIERFTQKKALQLFKARKNEFLQAYADALSAHIDEWHYDGSSTDVAKGVIPLLNENYVGVDFNGLSNAGIGDKTEDAATGAISLSSDLVYEFTYGDQTSGEVHVQLSNFATNNGNADCSYTMKRFASGVTELYIYIPTTYTYYLSHVAGAPNCQLASNTMKRPNLAQYGLSAQNTGSSPSEHYTSVSVLVEDTLLSVDRLLEFEVNGNSLPLKIYRDNDNSENEDGASMLFHSFVEPSVAKTTPANLRKTDSGDYVFEFACFGSDAQAVKIACYDAVNGMGTSTFTVKFNANGANGQMPTQKFNIGLPKLLRANRFAWPESNYKIFYGWTTKANPADNDTDLPDLYTDRQEFMLTSSQVRPGQTVNLYAVWLTYQFSTEDTALVMNPTQEEFYFSHGGVTTDEKLGNKVVIDYGD